MKNFLDYASKKYHEGNPIISDAEFDALAEAHNYENVGHSVQHGVPHHFPMYSLKKCYVGEKQIELPGDKVESPKLDGSAISLLYVNGKLTIALTRGDGKRGEDITDKIMTMEDVPMRVTAPGFLQVTGEVVAHKDVPNSRNYASGALNLKSVEEFRNRKVNFVAHGVQPYLTDTYYEDMAALSAMGFTDIFDRDFEEYPQDGKVYRLNDNAAFDAAGFTSAHPRGAYALKERGEGIRTILRRVDWQVGRTGAVSPVAIMDPVVIGEATVTRATLHNLKYIRELGLDIGCGIEVIRAGEIIPRVVRRVND